MPASRTLQEVALAVHFGAPVPLRITDIVDWISIYGEPHPVFQEMPPLLQTQLPVIGQPPAVSVQMSPLPPILPRIFVKGRDANSFSILQNDRVAFGWRRDVEVGEDALYPGYIALRQKWVGEIQQFLNWLVSRTFQSISPRLVELTYNNAYPLIVDGKQRRLSDMLRIIDADYRPLNAFSLSWAETLGTTPTGVITAQAGLGHAPGGQRVLGVNYFGLASADGADGGATLLSTVTGIADQIHARIIDMHTAAIITAS